MGFALYSIFLILGFASTRWITENFKLHVRTDSIWLHHWVIAAILRGILAYFQVESEIVWGYLTGVSIEGLGRKNWSLLRKQ